MAFLRRLGSALRAWIAGAPGWLGGVLAGLQAALFSLALVVIPTWTIVAAAPPADGALTPDWGASTTVAAHLWLLGFGVPWSIDGASISLIPLGLPLVTALMLAALARRFADKTWTSWLCAVAAFGAVVAAVVMMTGGATDGSQPRLSHAILASVAISAPAVAIGIWRSHGATLAWVRRIPEAVRAGLTVGAVLVGLQVVVAALAGAVWTAVGRQEIADIATGLGPDTAGGLALALMETLWVPTLVVWFMSWFAGVGFEVGLTHFAPGVIVDGALPQIPLVGALPQAYGGPLAWAPVVLVVIAATVWWVLRGRMPEGRSRLVVMAVAVAVVFVSTATLGWLASGAIGPGVLAYTGVQVWAFAAVSAALAGLGCVVGEVTLWGVAWLREAADPAPRSPVKQAPRTPLKEDSHRLTTQSPGSPASASSKPAPRPAPAVSSAKVEALAKTTVEAKKPTAASAPESPSGKLPTKAAEGTTSGDPEEPH